MRKIKFNAWVPKLGIMLENITLYNDGMMGIYSGDFEEALPEKYILNEDIVYHEDTEKDIYEEIMTVLPGEDWIWIEEGEFEPLQFTGLTDKNGKEIFEGHIIKEIWVDNDKKDLVHIGKVIFDSGMFHINNIPLYVSVDIDNNEIIGNIFENPELLTHD